MISARVPSLVDPVKRQLSVTDGVEIGHADDLRTSADVSFVPIVLWLWISSGIAFNTWQIRPICKDDVEWM